MKILHVIDSGGLYGAEAMLLALAEEQQRLGLDPTILSIGTAHESEKPLEREADRRRIAVRRWRMRAGPNLAGGYRIARFARDHGFNVLHSHGYKGNFVIGALPRRLRRLPFVSTLHGWTAAASWNRMAVYQWLDQKMIRMADAVVVVNPLMLEDPRIARIDKGRTWSIRNGIRIGGEQDASPDEDVVEFCRDGYIVGAVGRLSPEKGFNFLIDAFAALARDHPNMKLLILGEGPTRRLLEHQLGESGLSGKVILPGYRPTAACYMQHFSLFVLPSLTEGTPITLLEAMAARVPVIATRVGGVPDVLANGAGGSLVDAGSSAQLRDVIWQHYSGAIDARSTAEFSYQRIQEHYSIEHMAHKYLQVYRHVVDRSGALN